MIWAISYVCVFAFFALARSLWSDERVQKIAAAGIAACIFVAGISLVTAIATHAGGYLAALIGGSPAACAALLIALSSVHRWQVAIALYHRIRPRTEMERLDAIIADLKKKALA